MPLVDLDEPVEDDAIAAAIIAALRSTCLQC